MGHFDLEFYDSPRVYVDKIITDDSRWFVAHLQLVSELHIFIYCKERCWL